MVTGKYYGMDHDAYQHEIEEECLEESGHTLPEDKTYESQMSYNPYDLHMGQMTVYRWVIHCIYVRKIKLQVWSTRALKHRYTEAQHLMG